MSTPNTEQEAPASLHHRFSDVYKLLNSIDAGKVSAEDRNATLNAALGQAHDLSARVRAARLFSTNESISEVETEHIRFLLVEYFVAKLSAQSQGDRLTALTSASSSFLHFLEMCRNYELLSAKERQFVDAEGKVSSNLLRELKIESFKREKAAKSRLKVFLAIFEWMQASSSRAGAATV